LTKKTSRPAKAAVDTSRSILRRRIRFALATDSDARQSLGKLMAGWLNHQAELLGEPIKAISLANGSIQISCPPDFDLSTAKSDVGWCYREWQGLERQYGPKYVRNAAQGRRHRPPEERANSAQYNLRRQENSNARAELRRIDKTKAGRDLSNAQLLEMMMYNASPEDMAILLQAIKSQKLGDNDD